MEGVADEGYLTRLIEMVGLVVELAEGLNVDEDEAG